MKAAVRTRYGPPDVVRIEDVDRPAVGERDVLVRVHATTVNRTDCGFRSGKPFLTRLVAGIARPRAQIMGTEFAGVVEAIGDRVTSFAVGDRVFGFREWKFGAHAEYLTVPEDDAIAPMPEGFSFEEVAPATEASHYALTNIRAARGGTGQDWLVYGATGAIGSSAVQLLKDLGATVTAVCASPHLGLVKGLGADRVVDYTAEDFTQDEQRSDVVFDAVGKTSFGACKRLLKPRGVFLCTDLGPRSQNPFLAIATPPLGGRRVRFPLPARRDRRTIEHFKELMESGASGPSSTGGTTSTRSWRRTGTWRPGGRSGTWSWSSDREARTSRCAHSPSASTSTGPSKMITNRHDESPTGAWRMGSPAGKWQYEPGPIT